MRMHLTKALSPKHYANAIFLPSPPPRRFELGISPCSPDWLLKFLDYRCELSHLTFGSFLPKEDACNHCDMK